MFWSILYFYYLCKVFILKEQELRGFGPIFSHGESYYYYIKDSAANQTLYQWVVAILIDSGTFEYDKYCHQMSTFSPSK